MNILKLLSVLLASSIVLFVVNAASADHHEKGDHADHAVHAVKSAVKTHAAKVCTDMGPQTPRDITGKMGKNTIEFDMAPAYTEMNLCNIHTHTNAEHKGPGFNVFVNDTDHGGYACNDTASLTEAERTPYEGKESFKGVKPGDTIEVHWVHTSCDIKPGEGLGSCLSDTCTDPLLRVEAQIFLVVNDNDAPDFNDYDYVGAAKNGFHQAKSIPSTTGEPVVFRGSTTGPKYNQSECSPLSVTWSVRPQCSKVSVASLHKWAESGNVFKEDHSHGVRQLVTHPALLAPIE